MKATIMIPAYNVENFIEKTLQSAINQTYKGEYEILIVNDGSIDDTRNIIEHYQNQYPNIKLINQENQGVGKTRNNLLKKSKGKILFGLDADDLLYPKALEKIINHFESNPQTSVVYSDHEEIDERENLIRTRNKENLHKYFDDIILHCHYPGHVRAFRKESIGKNRFNPELKVSEDYDFLLKIIMKQWPNFQVGHIPEILYSYRINTNGLSQTQSKDMEYTAGRVLEKHIRENKVYENKEFEIVPVRNEKEIVFWDHKVEGKNMMKLKTKDALAKFLTD